MEVLTPESVSSDTASRTCVSCKERKRKCDKSLPTCSLCRRMKWKCEYTQPRARRAKSIPHQDPDSRHRIDELPIISRSRTNFPVVFFLDPQLFQQGRLELPRPDVPVPQHVKDLVGDITAIREAANEYFHTIHRQLSIISRKVFYEHLLNPLCEPRPETVLLLLCMRLVVSVPQGGVAPAETLLYQSAKQFFSVIEAAGICSVQVLQAGNLIGLYEIAHAIYPAAFLTVGACARYGSSFGFDGRGMVKVGMAEDWIEVEERKRVWWAVLILDRFVNLGNPTRVLATEDPETSSVLPIDDDAWDKGSQPSDQGFTLSAPSSLSMGRFARFSQAAYLLGRVQRHVSDINLEDTFRDEMAIQLHRTLHSLISISEIEASIRNTEFCTQTALCHSALLILHGQLGMVPGVMSVGMEHYRSLESIAQAAATVSAYIVGKPSKVARATSSFLLHFLYRASIVFKDQYRSTGSDEAKEAVALIKSALEILDERWKASGAYLQILQARDAIYY